MNILYLDTETTSVDPATAYIVELGALLCGPQSGGCPAMADNCYLYCPPVPIPPEASAIHGYTDTVITGHSPVKVDDHRASWIGQMLREADILCGHNILAYDLPILRREFPVLFGGCRLPVLDTLRLARHIWPDIPSHALQVLRYRFNLPTTCGSPHGAAFDAYLCKGLVEHIKDKELEMQADGSDDGLFVCSRRDDVPSGHGNTADLALVDLSIQPIMVTTIRFGKHSGMKVRDLPRDYVRWLLGQAWLATEQLDLLWTLKQLGSK